MDEIMLVLILFVLVFKYGNELLFINIKCLSLCVCNGDMVNCSGYGFYLWYILLLFENIISFVFMYNFLKLLCWKEDVFKNIFGLYLMKFDLKSNWINSINRLVFWMFLYL